MRHLKKFESAEVHRLYQKIENPVDLGAESLGKVRFSAYREGKDPIILKTSSRVILDLATDPVSNKVLQAYLDAACAFLGVKTDKVAKRVQNISAVFSRVTSPDNKISCIATHNGRQYDTNEDLIEVLGRPEIETHFLYLSTSGSDRKHLRMLFMVDDWVMLTVYHKGYDSAFKCDGLSGVRQCLEDLKSGAQSAAP
jgi:hypothetical protein